ncbi:MAG: UDP-N-acetylmuramoyl-tripeptide--D-alanyl-D-alanine ligase [Gammaproteobacteria bacterium]|nr:UDP-N-acetylmuramoyl-tripeptide--D-alanyl-D-alanine ligase [Gammaproteobacteria bacterium]
MGIEVKFSELAALERDATYSHDFVMSQLCTDTRAIQQGDTYLAIKGERFDGHDFIDAALSSGASSLVVSCDASADVPAIKVSDTVVALGNIAKIYRNKLAAKVIGITGSNGKTTVKGMVESICGQSRKVTATVANNNNTIGVPQTLLSASQQDEVVIVEMGTSELGEIAYLSSIVEPDVSIITNVSESHLSGIGSREDVFVEKSSIIQATKNDGTVVVNLDDDFSERVRQMVTADSMLTYGFPSEADVSGEYEATADGMKVFARSPAGQLEYTLSVTGRHNVANSLAAIAIACAVDIDVASMIGGLQEYTGARGRLQSVQLKHDITLIDDTYNANPASSIAALDVLAGCDGRKVFVFAGMAELGEQEFALHESVGNKATASDIDALFALGEVTQPTVNAFEGEKYHFVSVDELVASLLGFVKPGDVVLIKGSRRYQMDQVTDRLERELG